MDQCSCFHYNWVKKTIYFTTEAEGLKNLYGQLLTGDKVDNIPGIKGVGPKTAEKILIDCDGSSELELYLTCLKAYISKMPQDDEENDEDFFTRIIAMITQNMRLLYLCRSYGDLWNPPIA
jgi:5'-3' exonuclease